MRRKFTYAFSAALLVATTSAHAGFFPGSSLNGEASHSDQGKRLIVSVVQIGMLEEISDWVNSFHAESGSASSDAGDDLANANGCEADDKAPAKNTGKQSAKKDKPNDGEESKPSGPEPIYFGF